MKGDAITGQIAVAQARVVIERRRAAAMRYLGEKSVAENPPSLQNILRLAERSRERVERMTRRAQDTDARGEALEREANKIHDEHDILMDHVSAQYDDLARYNSEMRAQLGNDVPTPRASAGADKSSSDGSGMSG